MSRRRLALIVLALMAVCPSGGCRKVTVDTKPGDGTPPPKTTNGLEGAKQGRWRHLAEGSEIYPLAWLLALENPDTGKPFLDDPERFGLLADAKSDENPYGLPVGVTADYTRDLRFAGVQMIGINCAACHVNELHFKGKPVIRIDGAPNLFDLELFFTEIAIATKKTFTDAGMTWRFVRKLYEVHNPPAGPVTVSRVAKPADAVLQSYDTLAKMKEGALGKRLAQEIEAIHGAEVKRPSADLEKGLVVRPKGAALQDYAKAASKRTVKLTPELREAARALRVEAFGKLPETDAAKVAQVEPTRVTPLSKLPVAERARSIGDALDHFAVTIRLLKARADFLGGLARPSGLAYTAPGFGRVDAFGSARNRFFPADARAKESPVSYPHLWGLDQLAWLHWDANTTSVLERNAGQAIGLGALFDPATFDSTLLVDNLKELEGLALEIKPPKWPAAFGEIDAKMAARGKVLFDARCASCHETPAEGAKAQDRKLPLDEIGTDPLRARSFGTPVGDEGFDVALSRTLKALVRKAGGTTPDEKLWRVTKQYAGRPLRAIWATAPYLHNNSVPTLDDLLRPLADRPKTFSVGHREYDKKKLGYAAVTGVPSFLFDTRLPGNSNAGHDSAKYGTDMSKAERDDLLEYLKSL